MGPKSGIPPLAAARMQRWALNLVKVSLPCSVGNGVLIKRHVDQLLPDAPLRTTVETTVPPVTESHHPSPEIAVEPVVIPEDHLVVPVVIPEVNPVSPGVPADLLSQFFPDTCKSSSSP